MNEAGGWQPTGVRYTRYSDDFLDYRARTLPRYADRLGCQNPNPRLLPTGATSGKELPSCFNLPARKDTEGLPACLYGVNYTYSVPWVRSSSQGTRSLKRKTGQPSSPKSKALDTTATWPTDNSKSSESRRVLPVDLVANTSPGTNS